MTDDTDVLDQVHDQPIDQQLATLIELVRDQQRELAVLRDENAALREQVAAIEYKNDGPPRDADLGDIWIAGHPIGKILDGANARSKENQDAIDALDTEPRDHGPGASSRAALLPLHRMVIDVRAGQHTLGENELRAAHLFRRFIRQAAGDPGQNVDASGQTYTMNSRQAQDTLHEEGLLEDVAESSYSQIVGRAMRAVQRYTKTETEAEACACDSIDVCSHGLMEFRAGKPHAIRVPKEKFHAAMEHAADEIETE